jgi:hypothetical protein
MRFRIVMLIAILSAMGCTTPVRQRTVTAWPVDNDSDYYHSTRSDNDNSDFLLLLDQPQDELNYMQERSSDWHGRR